MRLDDTAKAELEAIVMEAFGNGGSSAEKGARYERLLLDAEQAQRGWAAAILDECRRQAVIADGRRRYQRLTAVAVSYKGEILSMPKEFPESSGPAEACRLAGTTIEAVISGEAAA